LMGDFGSFLREPMAGGPTARPEAAGGAEL
jgi:hypothetical protein